MSCTSQKVKCFKLGQLLVLVLVLLLKRLLLQVPVLLADQPP